MWWEAMNVYSQLGVPVNSLSAIVLRPSNKQGVEIFSVEDLRRHNGVPLSGVAN